MQRIANDIEIEKISEKIIPANKKDNKDKKDKKDKKDN